MEKALIDTSILLEPFTPWKNNEPNYKQRSLALIRGRLHPFNRKFLPVTSLSVMGEFYLLSHKKRKALSRKRESMIEIVEGFFRTCERVGLRKETLQVCREILSADERLDPLDALHIATAVTEGCRTFIFIDYGLSDNQWLQGFSRSKGMYLSAFNIKENADTKRPAKRLYS